MLLEHERKQVKDVIWVEPLQTVLERDDHQK